MNGSGRRRKIIAGGFLERIGPDAALVSARCHGSIVVLVNVEKSGPAPDGKLSPEHLADVAHDLRAPLGGIEAIALLWMSPLDSGQKKLVEGLKSASAHLRAVANHFLVVDQSDAPLHQRLVSSVHAVVTGFEISAGARARARGINFRCEIAPSCDEAVIPDGVSLRRVLENLTDNAIRFTESGEVVLRIIPSLDRDEMPFVRFEMLDQGPGLTQKQSQVIFGRRVTLENRSAGAGLGLSIVSGLVLSFGGQCGAGPRSGSPGAHLWFTLPVVGYCGEAPASLESIESQLFPAIWEEATEYSPILVVDDHPSSRLVLKTVLEHMGFMVEATGTPENALRLLLDNRYAAVFTDMMMPEMDGCDFVEAIRALDSPTRHVPVACVTGRVSSDDKKRLIASGGQVFVEKPITIAAVQRAIDTLGLSPLAK